ncbi:hypothetical protein SAMN05421763_11554 [[Luteovulum] sphaeroides subsp. megalophilum]|nr:hypothetical protein SAMN05421763_11554 [[Luteovulum] sphaeroides subsp. megalophilum]
MDKDLFESLGAISMPQEDHYVVHPDNLSAVLTAALDHEATASIVGKTSKNPGAAFIVELARGQSRHTDEFFAKLEGRAGLSQALMDVVERRS